CKDIIINSDIVVAQFETTLDATIEAFKIAKENDVITILNPAPANKIPDELLKYTDIIIPNETEAATLTGIEVTNLEEAEKAAKSFLSKGVKYSIITLGEKGAALVSNEKSVIVPAYKVKAVDTTAAGDSFIGALSAKLDKKNVNFDTLIEAVKFGNKVSSIVVQKEGAQPSIPFINDIENI
ncbi:MAG: ribokinase, partial [Clostridium butyricum]|nr:ribokinase [Clostridium butyricum]